MKYLRVLPFAAAVLGAMSAFAQPVAPIPASETLVYTAEWRLIHAANARLTWKAANHPPLRGGTRVSRSNRSAWYRGSTA